MVCMPKITFSKIALFKELQVPVLVLHVQHNVHVNVLPLRQHQHRPYRQHPVLQQLHLLSLHPFHTILTLKPLRNPHMQQLVLLLHQLQASALLPIQQQHPIRFTHIRFQVEDGRPLMLEEITQEQVLYRK